MPCLTITAQCHVLALVCLNKKRATLIFSNFVAREDPRLNLLSCHNFFLEVVVGLGLRKSTATCRFLTADDFFFSRFMSRVAERRVGSFTSQHPCLPIPPATSSKSCPPTRGTRPSFPKGWASQLAGTFDTRSVESQPPPTYFSSCLQLLFYAVNWFHSS